jgi:hypothetical protein
VTPSPLSGEKRLEALLDAPNAQELVRSTPAEDLYFAIAEVGLADATELVQLASPKQFKTFVDLGVWSRDRLEPHKLLTWLRAARGDEREDFLSKVNALDLELLEALLRGMTVVHDLEDEPDLHVEGVTLQTPDGKYLVEIQAEGVEQFALRDLLEDLIAQNPFQASRLFEALRWELPSELEETAYQFRSARLADLGFPELEVAMGLFAYVQPRPFLASSVEHPSDALAREVPTPDFLAAVLAGLTPEERETVEAELRYLVNAVLVAEGAEPGELAAVKSVSERARDYLLLGLEYLSGGDAALAPEVVRAVTPKQVFQTGFSLTLELKFRADRLMRAPLAKVGGLEWVLPAEAKVLHALRRKRPLKALKVEGAEPVPFRTRRELAEARAALDRVEAQLQLFAALLGPTPEGAREKLAALKDEARPLSPERLLVAAIAQALLGGSFAPIAIPVDRLAELRGWLPGSPRAEEGLERLDGAMEKVVPNTCLKETWSAVRALLPRLRDELAELLPTT